MCKLLYHYHVQVTGTHERQHKGENIDSLCCSRCCFSEQGKHLVRCKAMQTRKHFIEDVKIAHQTGLSYHLRVLGMCTKSIASETEQVRNCPRTDNIAAKASK